MIPDGVLFVVCLVMVVPACGNGGGTGKDSNASEAGDLAREVAEEAASPVDVHATDMADAATTDLPDVAATDLPDGASTELTDAPTMDAGDADAAEVAPEVPADQSLPTAEAPCFVSQLTWLAESDDEPLGWHPVVAALPSGRFLVAWTVGYMQDVPPEESGVRAVVFGKDGVALCDPFWVSAMPPVGVSVPNDYDNRIFVAPAGEDRFMVVWPELRDGQQLLLSRIIDEDGKPFGGGETTMMVKETDIWVTALAFRGDRLLLGWSEVPDAIFVQEVTVDGGLSGSPIRVDDALPAGDGMACTERMVAADIFPDGSAFVAWSKGCGPEDSGCIWRHISGRWLDADFNVVGPEFKAIENINDTEFLDLWWPSVVAFPVGTAVVTAVGPFGVVGNWVGSGGETGTPHLISDGNEGDTVSAVTVTRLDDHTGLVLWDNWGWTIGGRMIRPPLDLIGPTFVVDQPEGSDVTGVGPLTAAALDSNLFVVTYSYLLDLDVWKEVIRGKIFSRECPAE